MRKNSFIFKINSLVYISYRATTERLLLTITQPLICSLSYSYSGKSSLRSSTEDELTESSRNSSFNTPRYTVLMLGAAEVGKTTLAAQFMTSSNIGTYNNESIGNVRKKPIKDPISHLDFRSEEDYGEKCVNVLLDGEEDELVFIDHPSTEMSVSNLLEFIYVTLPQNE